MVLVAKGQIVPRQPASPQKPHPGQHACQSQEDHCHLQWSKGQRPAHEGLPPYQVTASARNHS
eukprot:1858619-Amphidinium_carterae.3